MRLGLFALTVLTVILGLPSDGLACFCGGAPCQTLTKSDSVFEATIESIHPAPPDIKSLLVNKVIVRPQ